MQRCENCGVCLDRTERHLVSTLPQQARAVLSVWLAVDEEEILHTLLCHACYRVLSQCFERNSPRRFGHHHVCASCGRCLSRIRYHLLDNTPLKHYFPWTQLIQNHQTRHIACHTCWVFADRQYRHDVQRGIIEQYGNDVYMVPAGLENIPAPAQLPVSHGHGNNQDLAQLPASPIYGNDPAPAQLVQPHIYGNVSAPVQMPQSPFHGNGPAPVQLPESPIQENVPVAEPLPEPPFLGYDPAPPQLPQPAVNVNGPGQALPQPLFAPVPDARLIYLPHYKRASNTSRRCIFRNCVELPWFLIPTFIKTILLKEHNFYVPRSARVCRHHLYSHEWHNLPQEIVLNLGFTIPQIEDVIGLSKKKEITFDFENVAEMPNHICHYWTSLEVFEFLALFNELDLQVRNPKMALAIFLIKLRTGDSNKRLSTLFDIPRATLETRMNKVRAAFLVQFVPIHIGLQHLSHENVVERNLSIPNAFFGQQIENERPAITICDGTYIYIQKSSNYFYQKATYSLHKHENLVKPFMIVSCDGHIIDVVGPYAATQTDAEIMRDLFSDVNDPMRTFFHPNDVFILDRGFRDAIPLLEFCGYQIKKPESLLPGQRQLTTSQANRSRMVTLCRWVVEVVNGRFKRDFKIFRQKYFNRAHRHLMEDFKIAASLLNRFHPVIEDRADAPQIIERALSNLNTQNHLSQFVTNHNLGRRLVMFNRIDARLPQLSFFPQLRYSELILLALGPYQVKEARSYYGEHARQNGSYIVEVCPNLEYSRELNDVMGGNRPYLIRGRIKSRHVGRLLYCTYIVVDARPVIRNSLNCILGYYCSCIVGNRTVGCCSHVMTIVWYLSWARHEGNITPPACFLDDILITINE